MKNTTSTTQQADRWSAPRPPSRSTERAWDAAREATGTPPPDEMTPPRTPRATRATFAPVFEYRFTRRRIAEPAGTVHDPDDVAAILAYYLRADEAEQERLAVALLDVKHQVLGVETLYVGNAAGSPVRVGEVFRAAVRVNASAIAIAHNHPSGDATPSPDDLELTRTVAAAGHLLDIPLLDHLIVGRGARFVSLRQLGAIGV